MKPSTARRLAPVIALFLAWLLAPALVAAQGGPPQIPHPLEGRDACLGCHEAGLAGAPKVPADHAGRTNDMCRLCHQPASASATSATASATPPAAAGGPPAIPHSLVGRQNCLACHQEGVGGAPRVPQDHAGRTIDMCQGCHKAAQALPTPAPTPLTELVPTPIPHPRAEGVNTCLDCHTKLGGKHADITAQWQRSVHAERDVSCADCHGGNPAATTVDAAMSPAAGYIGVPAKVAIPPLCASCHADVALMRQYNLPTDQFAKYKESVHGTLLAKGDAKVATCDDCHGGHQILKANDPASSVYVSSVPNLCASCHADKALMAPYGIPTDQFDLYRQSVHGRALLDKQDFRAPNCATCHGTHGAAPPGLTEVANVCGGCHSATQNYYLTSAHAKVGDNGPRCITCHGNHDLNEPTEALYVGSEPRHCGACHSPDSAAGKVAQSLYDGITSAVTAYGDAEKSIQSARTLGMLVSAQESELQGANTGIITARAAQHTLAIDTVTKETDAAQKAADQAKTEAEAAIAESIFRRRAMIIAVAAIALTILALYMLKRELDRRLEAQS